MRPVALVAAFAAALFALAAGPAARGGADSLPAAPDGVILAPAIRLASAGDVDANGATDWLHSDPNATPNDTLTNAGRVYLYRNSPADTSELRGKAPYDQFGAGLAAGDVDGDGYDDVIIGAPGHGQGSGRVYVYRGGAGGLYAGPPWTFDGSHTNELLGNEVAAGDVNGDGYADVIVGCPLYNNGVTFGAGRVLCFLGGPNGLPASPSRTLLGTSPQQSLGHSVASGADINGDGYDDVVAGAPGYTNGHASEGRIVVALGGGQGMVESIWFSEEANQFAAGWGRTVALPGDMNGDGHAEFAVGAPDQDVAGNDDRGRVTVWNGAASVALVLPIYTNTGFVLGGRLGADLAPAGDVNSDGYADLVIGEPGLAGAAPGLWHVLYGASNLSVQPILNVWSGASSTNAGQAVSGGGDTGDGEAVILVGSTILQFNATESPGLPEKGMTAYPTGPPEDHLFYGVRTFTRGPATGRRFGAALALADVDGDGFSDAVVGAPDFGGTGDRSGRVSLYRGSAAGFTKPFPVPERAPDWEYLCPLDSAQFGRSVANAGDVNGDGYEDVIVGATEATYGQPSEGAAFLFTGGPAGLSQQPAWRSEGNVADGQYGWAVAGAGDVNQDGYDDVLVGDPGASPGGVLFAGEARLYYGSAFGLATLPARVFVGSAVNAGLGYAFARAGDIDGDGYPEIAIAEPFASNGQTYEGRVRIHRGGAAGVDPAPYRLLEANVGNAILGYSVAGVGDVDGDGLADVLVGAPEVSNGQQYEGAAYLWTGAAMVAGPDPAPSQVLELNRANASFGQAVSAAGDVNGDGRSDVLIGAPDYVSTTAPGSPDEIQLEPFGRAVLYLADPATGLLHGVGAATYDVNTLGTRAAVGHALAGGGDINGDGWPDFLIAAPSEEGPTGQLNGAVSAVFVNLSGIAVDQRVRAMRTDNLAPIAPGLRSNATNAFRLHANARSGAGRERVRLEWQVRAGNQPFVAGGVQSTPFVRTGAPVPGEGSFAFLNALASGLAVGERYHWRARFATRDPYFPRTRWFSPQFNGARQADLRTAGPTGAVDAGDASTLARGVAFAGAAPNPLGGAHGPALLRFALPAAGRVRIDAFDAAGRRVARVLDEDAPAGPGTARWDGRDEAGRALPRGLYFLRLTFAGEERTTKAVIAG